MTKHKCPTCNSVVKENNEPLSVEDLMPSFTEDNSVSVLNVVRTLGATERDLAKRVYDYLTDYIKEKLK